MTPTPPDRSVEEIAKQLHGWYLEATKELNPENYNAKAQVAYDDMNEEQKEIDRYIARKVLSLYHQGFEAGRRDGTNLEMVKGYNREKEILSNRLTQLMTSNATISTRSSIQTRLREIDEALATLKHPNEPEK